SKTSTREVFSAGNSTVSGIPVFWYSANQIFSIMPISPIIILSVVNCFFQYHTPFLDLYMCNIASILLNRCSYITYFTGWMLVLSLNQQFICFLISAW